MTLSVEDRVANLNPEQIRRLARLGAVARLQQLREEEAAIREEFPELFGRGMPNTTTRRRGRKRAAAADAGVERSGGDGATRGRRRRRGMSAAQRKAVSIRMRKYWAERRKAKGAK